MGREHGQASIEWIAMLGVVAGTFLAALAGALPGADAIPRAVAAAFERAFCVVSGGDCLSGPPRPCVVGRDERSRERRATVSVVRLADGRTVVREERSDGTVAVTVEDGAQAGAAFLVGAGFSVGSVGARAGAEIGAHGRGAVGRRFVVRDARAADALVARLSRESEGVETLVGGAGDGPVPDEEWWAVGRGGSLSASLRTLRFGASAKAVAAAVVGLRTRPRTGERTAVLRTDSELVASLTAPLARLGMGLPQRSAVELAFDARGRAVSLTVRGARGVHGEARLGPWRAGGGDTVEVEARLDLLDPEVRALTGELVEAIGDVAPRQALAAARGLGERLAERARVDVRLYETDRSASVQGATGGTFGVRLGYEVEKVRRTARLVDAAGREPGMGWARRLDCVGVA